MRFTGRWLKNYTNELTYKTETESDFKNKHGYQRGKVGRKNNRESGVDICTLLYIKWTSQMVRW